MKKLLLSLLAFGFMYQASAQCTPDPQFTSPGVYPDSATGLAVSYVGQPYTQLMTAVVPSDTTTVVSGVTVPVTINSITVTSFTGLPTNYNYVCNPTNCSFPGGSSGCLLIFSTQNPTSPMVGRYMLTITLETQGTAQTFLGNIPVSQTDVVDYYYIDIEEATPATVGELKGFDFEVLNASPNPAIEQTRLEFVSGNNSNYQLIVTNLLGEQVYSTNITAHRGKNTAILNVSDWSEGIYIYTLTNGQKTVSKKLVVNK
jgi:hypothetical protein